MKAKNITDDKAARKAYPRPEKEKIDKQKDIVLGPGEFGITQKIVDKRITAISQLDKFINDYLTAVDSMREVSYKDAAAFVVCSNNVKFQ